MHPSLPTRQASRASPPAAEGARGGGQRDGLGCGLRLPFAGEKRAACPIPAAWHRRYPRWLGPCLPAQHGAIPGGPGHPSTAMSAVHPCPASGARVLRPSGLCQPRPRAVRPAARRAVRPSLLQSRHQRAGVMHPSRSALRGEPAPWEGSPLCAWDSAPAPTGAQPRRRRVKPSPGRATLLSGSRGMPSTPLDRRASSHDAEAAERPRGLCARVPRAVQPGWPLRRCLRTGSGY